MEKEIEELKKRVIKLEKRLDKLAPEPPVNDCYLFENVRGKFLVFLGNKFEVFEITQLDPSIDGASLRERLSKVWSIVNNDYPIYKDYTKMIEHWLPKARKWDYQIEVLWKDQDEDYKKAEKNIQDIIYRFF